MRPRRAGCLRWKQRHVQDGRSTSDHLAVLVQLRATSTRGQSASCHDSQPYVRAARRTPMTSTPEFWQSIVGYPLADERQHRHAYGRSCCAARLREPSRPTPSAVWAPVKGFPASRLDSQLGFQDGNEVCGPQNGDTQREQHDPGRKPVPPGNPQHDSNLPPTEAIVEVFRCSSRKGQPTSRTPPPTRP